MSMIGFPLLLVPLAVYNIIVFLMPGVPLAGPVVTLTLMSGAEWPLTLSDVLVALGIVLLLFEVIKGARPGAKFLTDHLLSLIVAGGAAAEFLLLPRFATSTYFMLAMLALVDFLSGLALRARRGTQAPALVASGRGVRRLDPAMEPEFEPVVVPSPAAPGAASVAESVQLDRPEPSVPPPSPQVPSPGLQPGNGLPPSPELPPR
jgi:hypothetical protein